MADALPEPKPEVLERPSNGGLGVSSAPPEGADPDPDQYLWGV